MSFSFKKSNYLLVGVLVIVITFSLKVVGYRNGTITTCFSKITVTDGSSYILLSDSLSCGQAVNVILLKPYVKTASIPVPHHNCIGCRKIYCVTLAETDDSAAPLADVGFGKKRYMIETIYCGE